MNEIQQIERSMAEEIQAFREGRPWAKPRRRPAAAVNPQETVVRLAVRERRLAPDVEFAHRSRKISRLEARLEAEKMAREAGYPIVGYVVDIETH